MQLCPDILSREKSLSPTSCSTNTSTLAPQPRIASGRHEVTLHPAVPRIPRREAVLFCSIHFQGQMVFASLTFTADIVLFAGFSQVASFPLFQFILPLAPLSLSVSCSSRWQGDNWGSQQVDVFREPARPSSHSSALPALGKHHSGSLEIKP